jgi:cytochrome c-type biogenesis protein CcmH/NrfF
MRAFEFEDRAKAHALRIKQKLEHLFLTQRLDRCRRGLPVNPRWEANWKSYIQRRTLAALTAPLRCPQSQNAE